MHHSWASAKGMIVVLLDSSVSCFWMKLARFYHIAEMISVIFFVCLEPIVNSSNDNLALGSFAPLLVKQLTSLTFIVTRLFATSSHNNIYDFMVKAIPTK